MVSNVKSNKRKASNRKQNVETNGEISTQQSWVGTFQSSCGAETNNLNRGGYGQLLNLAELQRVENIQNTARQFRVPLISSYGNTGSTITAYGAPYEHSGNVSPAQGVLSGHVESVLPAFGVPQP